MPPLMVATKNWCCQPVDAAFRNPSTGLFCAREESHIAHPLPKLHLANGEPNINLCLHCRLGGESAYFYFEF